MRKMTKKQITKSYQKLVSEIEEMKMYDGRGTVDEYVCNRCGEKVFTTYRDKGVTPFVMRCRKCGGDAVHRDTYRKFSVEVFRSVVKVQDWYRPSLEETLKMSEDMIDHVLNGGLVLSEY